MITVTVRRDEAGRVDGFRMQGHANFADYGEDIVCAAVSAIAQTAVQGLVRLTDANVEVEQSSGWLLCELKDGTHAGEAATAILETMLLGLGAIAGQYPRQVEIREFVAQFGEGRRAQWPS